MNRNINTSAIAEVKSNEIFYIINSTLLSHHSKFKYNKSVNGNGFKYFTTFKTMINPPQSDLKLERFKV